jgi:hypothetical protein
MIIFPCVVQKEKKMAIDIQLGMIEAGFFLNLKKERKKMARQIQNHRRI